MSSNDDSELLVVIKKLEKEFAEFRVKSKEDHDALEQKYCRLLDDVQLLTGIKKLEKEFAEFRVKAKEDHAASEQKYYRLLDDVQLLTGKDSSTSNDTKNDVEIQLQLDGLYSTPSQDILVSLQSYAASEDTAPAGNNEREDRDKAADLLRAGDVAGATLNVANKFVPSRKTITIVWATISITLMNFGYFTGGYYAFKYFRSLHEDDTVNKTMGLYNEKVSLVQKYPVLEYKLDHYSNVSEILCTISKHPQPKWGYWSSFDFCVSIVTTVGYGVLAPQTWIGRLLCIFYAAAGLPLYIIMLGASGKYISSMFEKLDCCKSSNIVLELTIKYLNIAIVLGAFLCIYSYFGLQASRVPAIPEGQLSIIEMAGLDYGIDFNGTKNTVKIGVVEWSILETFYYSMISLTTIGFGDYFLAKTNDPSQAFMLFLSVTFGFALFSYAFETYAQASERQIKYFKEKAEKMSAMAAKKSAEASARAASRAAKMTAKAASRASSAAGDMASKVSKV